MFRNMSAPLVMLIERRANNNQSSIAPLRQIYSMGAGKQFQLCILTSYKCLGKQQSLKPVFENRQ